MSILSFRTCLALAAAVSQFVIAPVALSQVVLNEVMADNEREIGAAGVFPDYIELYNSGGLVVELGGMSLTDDPLAPRKYVFPSPTPLPAGGFLRVWCDTNAALPGLRASFGLSSDGEDLRLYKADGITLADRVVFGLQAPDHPIGRVPDGSASWTLVKPSPATANEIEPLASVPELKINEWMARPASGEDWLEVYNGSVLPAPLGGLVLTDTPSGTPANRAIPALSFVGARGHVRFFASDLASQDADHLDFKLSATGETLTLYAANRATVIDRVVFGAQQDNISQGRSPDGSDNIVAFPPGRDTPDEPNFAAQISVVISEVLSHTDPPLEDAIELFNPSNAPVDISNWWLSDSAAVPRKYKIPAGTVLPAQGYRVFYQYQFMAGTNGFSLSSTEGETVFLSASDAAGNLTGGQTSVDFGATRNGVPVGRFPTTAGVDFVPLSRRTFGVDNPATIEEFRLGTGAANAPARIGPLVISEIQYAPSAQVDLSEADSEYLELHNPTPALVTCYDPLYPTNTWRVREGISFDFPQGVTLAPNEFLLLVGFDPAAEPATLAAFQARYAVPASTRILGPFSGHLSDTGEGLRLLWPDEPQGPDKPDAGFVPYEQVERVRYSDIAPWPVPAPNSGQSLQRLTSLAYGNEPTNWVAAAPTAGRALVPNADADTDGDGMPDAWETTYGLNPASPADAGQDKDGDRATNLEEYQAGTDPTNRASVFAVAASLANPNQVTLRFSRVAGRSYEIQFRPADTTEGWQVIGTVPAATSGGVFATNLPIARTAGVYRVATAPK